MTDKALHHVAKALEINLKTNIDGAAMHAFLNGLFTSWERGRRPYAGENGASYTGCDQAAYAEIWQATTSFIIGIVKSTLEGTVPAIRTAYFTEGARAGVEAAAKQLKAAPPKLPAMVPRVLDTDILVKSIGEEIRKAFEAGQASGKGAADAIIEAGKLAKPSGEIVKVQRNGAGEIVGAVKQLVYDGNGGG